MGTGSCIAGATLLAHLVIGVAGGPADAGTAGGTPVIDPEVHARVRTSGARVLVTLRIDETGDGDRRADAIGHAQDAVLARLGPAHASVVRRYASVPMLALEIDATALRALETMADVVVRVTLDRTMVPQ
jgi:hypothetical protein